MISIVLAAAMQTSPVVITQSQPNAPAGYVRVKMNVNGYGIEGTAQMLVDRRTGRYTEHFAIGPQSFYQGFDGTRAWQADVNGTTAIQGNAVDRGTIVAWGYLFALPRHARVRASTVRYDGVPQAATFTMDATNQVQRFSLFNGVVREVATFSRYRTFADGITAPGAITFTDDNGTWKARLTNVEPVSDAPPSDFAPPVRRDDSGISGGVTSVPFLMATEIIVPVRLNDGPVLHFMLDTGGQNVLLASTAKRLHLHTIGEGTVGGAGASVIPTRFVTVGSVRVGNAQMRNQPFIVLDTPILEGIDGVMGFELLSRFAARIDYRTNMLQLAASLPRSWTTGSVATPFSFRSRQPAVAGDIDGVKGTLTTDTGNSGVLDINSPFADKHHLWAYYHAAKPKRGSLAGVGGIVSTSNITVHRVQLGSATLQNVYADLTQATSGIEVHSEIAANAGEGIFRNFTFVLDYLHQRLYFGPGGIQDMSGVLLTGNGDRIVVRQVRTHFAMRAGIRSGMTLTSLNGEHVSARDLTAVQAALRGQPGSKVDLVFDGRKHVKLTLLNYL